MAPLVKALRSIPRAHILIKEKTKRLEQFTIVSSALVRQRHVTSRSLELTGQTATAKPDVQVPGQRKTLFQTKKVDSG